jgi:hypothetical protein
MGLVIWRYGRDEYFDTFCPLLRECYIAAVGRSSDLLDIRGIVNQGDYLLID